jgi:hypothetical protein
MQFRNVTRFRVMAELHVKMQVIAYLHNNIVPVPIHESSCL